MPGSSKQGTELGSGLNPSQNAKFRFWQELVSISRIDVWELAAVEMEVGILR